MRRCDDGHPTQPRQKSRKQPHAKKATLCKERTNADDKQVTHRAGLWHHRDVARRALEVGAIPSGNDLEAIRNRQHGWHVAAVLREAGPASLATGRTPQAFVPFVLHGGVMRADLGWFQNQNRPLEISNQATGAFSSGSAAINFSKAEPGKQREYGVHGRTCAYALTRGGGLRHGMP